MLKTPMIWGEALPPLPPLTARPWKPGEMEKGRRTDVNQDKLRKPFERGPKPPGCNGMKEDGNGHNLSGMQRARSLPWHVDMKKAGQEGNPDGLWDAFVKPEERFPSLGQDSSPLYHQQQETKEILSSSI